MIKYHLEILNVLSTCIFLCMTYSIHPTHKQTLLFIQQYLEYEKTHILGLNIFKK
jgi:hypothetical protein